MMNCELLLRRCKEKRARYASHEQFLTTCIKGSRIPKGFRLGGKANIGMDRDIFDKCERIKTDASLKLMELTNEACRQKLRSLTENMLEQESQADADIVLITDSWEKRETSRINRTKSAKLRTLKEEFAEVRVAADGNCFYRCLSSYFHSTEDYHVEIRKSVTDFIDRNSLEFESFIDGSVKDHVHDQAFADGSLGSWAMEAEIFAVSALYKVNVKVRRGNGNGFSWHTHTFRVPSDPTTNDPPPYNQSIHLTYVSNHYNLLLQKTNYRQFPADIPTVNKHAASGSHIDWFDLSPSNAMAGECNSSLGDGVSSRQLERPELERTNTGINTASKEHQPNRKSGYRNSNQQAGEQRTIRHKRENASVSGEVTNLSNYRLSSAETSLLKKGLKFIPDRSKTDSVKLLADLGDWERRMRLREIFYDEDDGDSDKKEDPTERFKQKKKSYFTPNRGRDGWLDMYIELVKNDIVSSLKKSKKLNVSRGESAAFYSLLNNPEIIIRPADKGSNLVIIDKAEYIGKLHQEMLESDSYCQVEDDVTRTATQRVKKVVNKMYREGAITRDLQQYMVPRHPVSGKLKGNPKLHKKTTPLRTIVSGMNTHTEKMAATANKAATRNVHEVK